MSSDDYEKGDRNALLDALAKEGELDLVAAYYFGWPPPLPAPPPGGFPPRVHWRFWLRLAVNARQSGASMPEDWRVGLSEHPQLRLMRDHPVLGAVPSPLAALQAWRRLRQLDTDDRFELWLKPVADDSAGFLLDEPKLRYAEADPLTSTIRLDGKTFSAGLRRARPATRNTGTDLAEWIFARHSERLSFEKLFEAACINDRAFQAVTKDHFRKAYRRVYQTEPHKPPAGGWPLKEPYRSRKSAEVKSRKCF